ncbi:MAE_28990/MAE_18760 family HEPN-like nuclease [Shewanella sp. 10N.286.45.A1]|uniref:MAE_28990/MAE_18760 family HEPN-like nuclease n=1 Tax=Shewanella sp. 10N.286.45.A1 TaxID=3229694 RepID=UPI00354DDD4D
MLSVKSAFQDRNDEAKKLLEHIASLSESGGVLESSILKSSYTLLLYNNLEATVSSSITNIHDRASGCKYDELSEEFKKLYASFYHFDISKRKVKDHLDNTVSGEFKFPNFEEYCKRITVFSGNIDLRSLNDISKSYGIGKVDLRGRNPENILTIKNKRNKLAHGEESFRDSCRQYTLSELQELGDSLERMLEKFIELVDIFLRERKYMVEA